MKRMIYQTDETREKILVAARQLFASQGFFDLLMQDVARSAGVSRQTLYRYYQHKASLGLAILQQVLEAQVAWLEALEPPAGMSGLATLAWVMERAFTAPELDADFRFMAEFDAYYAGNRIDADLARGLREVVRPDLDVVWVRLILQGQTDGSICNEEPAHLLAVSLLNALVALRQRLILRGSHLVETTMDERNRMMGVVRGLLLAGLAAEPMSLAKE